jgi:hypothetical protein
MKMSEKEQEKEKEENKIAAEVDKVADKADKADNADNADNAKDKPEVKDGGKKKPSLFLTADDGFSVKVTYQNIDGKILVKGVDSDYGKSGKEEDFSIECRYPSQNDADMISSRARMLSVNQADPAASIRVIQDLENFRLSVLMKSWTLEEDCSDENLGQLPPVIIKGIVYEIREKIGMDGIV